VPPVVELPAHLGTALDETAALSATFDFDRDLGEAAVGERSSIPSPPVAAEASRSLAFLRHYNLHREALI